MERSPGPLASQSTVPPKGTPDTPPPQPATMRRPVGTPPNALPNATLAGPVPPVPPLPDLRTVPSSSALSAAASVVPGTPTVSGPPASPAKVVSLFTDAIQNALQENEAQAQRAEGGGTGSELKPGVTIDLSRQGIRELPEEVVDVIKHELERLALSHNQISTFPARFSECTSLRYLNVRNNRIEEFPLALCDLKSLEILDLGRNRIHVLPPQIVKLTSLKVLSIRKNPIKELPLCLADMASLQVLKLKDNNITFPPPEVLQTPMASPPNENILPGSDMAEMAVTAHIKEYLRRVALNGRAELESAGDDSSEGAETPRFPIRRVASGRFPIKVNGSEVPDMRSPAAMNRPPPIPNRSHYRGLSQQSTTMRRTSAMPLTIGNVGERGRSNSETLMPQVRPERHDSRHRRMGIVSKMSSDLSTLDETQANNRFSHYRGLSHGSAMQGPGAAPTPASPPEPYMQRPIYVRRLSILPERRRESKMYDPVIEVAKGILYSVFQIHPMIQMLMSLTNDGSAKRSSLEIVFYNTNSHVEELEQAIQKHDPSNGEDEYSAHHDSENLHRACQTLVSAYTHVCTLLANNIELFVENGDPRYIRTLLVLLYNSIMELRVTMSGMGPGKSGFKQSAARAAIGVGDTIRPHSRENSVTPTAERHGMASRMRNGGYTPGPSNLRVATDVPMPSTPYANGARQTPLESATPRSGESFASASSAPLGRNIPEFADEDRLFEEVFLSLQRSAELVMRALPGFISQLTAGLRNIMTQGGRPVSDEVLKSWKLTISRATAAVQQTETLKARMSLVKLKEPGVRTQPAFWGVCNNFFHAWGTFGETMKEAMTRYRIPIPPDGRLRLRPIHQAMKETRDAILKSPWAYFLQGAGGGGGMVSPVGHHDGRVPVTPQSAALGPAVQATVPSTPQSGSFSGALSGNVFERADALLNYGGLSMGGGMGMGIGGGMGGMGMGMGSRTGTMPNSANSSFSGTLSSVGGPMTPGTVVSMGSGKYGRAAY